MQFQTIPHTQGTSEKATELSYAWHANCKEHAGTSSRSDVSTYLHSAAKPIPPKSAVGTDMPAVFFSAGIQDTSTGQQREHEQY